MASLEEQIASAVGLAVSATSSQEQRHEAYLFLQQVKDAHQETWSSCLDMFVRRRKDREWSSEVRMFACQVIGESLAQLGPEALAFVQSSLFDYFTSEYVNGKAENGVAFLKNASVLLATQLFLRVYLSMTPDFFSHFLAMLRQYPGDNAANGGSQAAFNPKTTDLLLRLLHEVSTEVSDVQLRLNKPTTRLNEDSKIRDAFRENDAARVAETLWQIITDSLAGLDVQPSSNGVGLAGTSAREIAEMAIRVAGDYVSLEAWIDINLMVTPTSMPLLLQAIHLPSSQHLPVRIATADTLLETISKGMPPQDKIALLNVLDIKGLLEQLASYGRTNGSSTTDDAVETFRSKLAALLNGAGLEMCKIIDDSSAEEGVRSTAHALTTSLLPLLLTFLADAADATSNAVHPFASSMLALYKKEKKRAVVSDPVNAGMTPEKRSFLTELLKTSLAKMTYGPDDEWEMAFDGEEEDDDLIRFYEKRKNLRVLSDAIAWLDQELYSAAVRSVIVPSLEAYESGGPSSVPWQRLELALTLLYDYGTATGHVARTGFVRIPPEDLARSKREHDFKLNYSSYSLSTLGELLVRTCQAKVYAYPHGAVTLQFFECTVRYHEFFSLCPEFIADVLPSFMDEHGLHHQDAPVRARCCYLFSRFIYQTKTSVQAQVSGEVISNVLSRMQDLLSIEPELPTDASLNEKNPPVELLNREWKNSPQLDSQLYLFEAVGTLISMLNQIPDQQIVLLQAVLTPMLSTLRASVRTSATTTDDVLAVVEARHLIMAIGNIAKGFPDFSSRGGSTVPPSAWVAGFKDATEQVLSYAKSMNGFYIIRDAARFAFNRIVATTGEAILDLIPSLIECLIDEITFPELGDLLSFVTHLLAKYKSKFYDVLDQLFLPLFNRVIHFLGLPIAGTDDAMQHSMLKRAYFSFLNAVLNSEAQTVVLHSDRNKSVVQDVLASVPHYISTPESQVSDQKSGFALLARLAAAWVDPIDESAAVPRTNGSSASTTNASATKPSPVPGFEQFLYSSVVKLCFEVPLRSSFDYSDAQSYHVIGEICLLLTTLSTRRKDEFRQFLVGTLFPSIQCPNETGQSFVQALEGSQDVKAFKKFASDWFKTSRAG